MEKTFESKSKRIHEGFTESKTIIEMNLSVKYDPEHRIRNRILMAVVNMIMRTIRSDFRMELIKHE